MIRKRLVRWLPAAATTMLLAACGIRTPIPDISPLPAPLAQPVGNVGAAPRVNGNVGAPDASPPAQAIYGATASLTLPAAAGAADAGPGEISLDFADTDIREVVNQILGTILRVSYTIDPAVHGTATFHTAAPLPRSRLLPTLQALLSQNGASMVQAGGLYRVVPIAEAAGASAASSDAIAGSMVIPLRYASAEPLAKLLQPFLTNGAKLLADPGRNAILISAEPLARASLAGLVQSFDSDQLAGQSYALLPVPTGAAKDFASALLDAIRGGHEGPLAGLVRIVPLERLSAVLVAAQSPRYLDAVRRVYELVEKGRRFTVRSWHVYYLQNSHSDDVAYVLQQAFTPNNVTAQPSGSAAARQGGGGFNASNGGGSGGGGLGSSGLGGGGSGSGLGSTTGAAGSAGGSGRGGLGTGGLGNMVGGQGGSQGGGASGQGAASAGGGGGNPLLGGLDQAGGNTDTDTMRIIPNSQNNAVLVYATPQEEGTVEAMLRKIDILPLQVRIDAVIAEVTLNDALQYGTQFFFHNGSLNETLSTAGSVANGAIAGNFPGFVLASSSKAVNSAISALQSVTTVKVLSSPELLVLDNQPARLLVGSLVPYLTQSSQSTLTNGSPIINSVDYRQTGVILEVTPRVNSGGLVTLDVSQEVSAVDTAAISSSAIQSPTFTERNVVSRVVIQDGQTIGLAGLIQENQSRGNSGIPWLKDVPVLGLLAGSQSNSRTRTELLVLVTPHVVHDQRDAQALTEDLREQLPNAALVPQSTTQPLSGSPDPSQRLRHRLDLGP